jgi:cytochrome c1
MKRSSLKNTVAALLAMGSLGTAPMQQVKAETTTQNEIAGSNKQAVENKETKGQGISINRYDGGLDFNFFKIYTTVCFFFETTKFIFFPL